MDSRREWSLIRLRDIVAGLEAGVSVNAEGIPASNGDIGVLKTSAISSGKFFPQENKRVKESQLERARVSVTRDTILISRMNTLELVGASAYVDADYPRLFLPDRLWKLTVRTDSQVRTRWLAYLLTSDGMREYIRSQASGTSGSMKNLTQDDLLAMQIACPPIDTQDTTIAVLYCWDRAIDQTEALIAAKERRKQALMQQLLTGKRRFPGCTKPWHTARLADMFDPVYRTTTEEIDAVLSISSRKGFERQEKKYSKIIAGKNIEHYILLRKGEFAYNKGNSKTYPQGCVFRLDSYEEAIVPNVYFCFRIKDDHQAQSDFFKFVFEAGLLNSGLRSLINTGVRNNGLLNIHEPSFYELALCYPDAAEQQRIAAVLNICDQELCLLRTQLTALKLQKRGLMQKLLTGEVSVPVAEAGCCP